MIHRIETARCEILLYTGGEELDPVDDNVDLEVCLPSGQRYTATLFTVANVRRLMSTHATTGENLGGLYLQCEDMILVRDLRTETVRRFVEYLLDQGSIAETLTLIRDPAEELGET